MFTTTKIKVSYCFVPATFSLFAWRARRDETRSVRILIKRARPTPQQITCGYFRFRKRFLVLHKGKATLLSLLAVPPVPLRPRRVVFITNTRLIPCRRRMIWKPAFERGQEFLWKDKNPCLKSYNRIFLRRTNDMGIFRRMPEVFSETRFFFVISCLNINWIAHAAFLLSEVSSRDGEHSLVPLLYLFVDSRIKYNRPK